jgi:hypothetical protein
MYSAQLYSMSCYPHCTVGAVHTNLAISHVIMNDSSCCAQLQMVECLPYKGAGWPPLLQARVDAVDRHLYATEKILQYTAAPPLTLHLEQGDDPAAPSPQRYAAWCRSLLSSMCTAAAATAVAAAAAAQDSTEQQQQQPPQLTGLWKQCEELAARSMQCLDRPFVLGCVLRATLTAGDLAAAAKVVAAAAETEFGVDGNELLRAAAEEVSIACISLLQYKDAIIARTTVACA